MPGLCGLSTPGVWRCRRIKHWSSARARPPEMTQTACLEITNGYYDTVPAFPPTGLGTWERREWVGNQMAKGLICHGFSFRSVSGTTWSKSLKFKLGRASCRERVCQYV